MTAGYQRLTDETELPRLLSRLAARTIIVDVEPLIATWYGDRDALDQGIARFLELIGPVESVIAVCFATNSARVPAVLPDAGVQVRYLASARKPLHTAPYRDLPVPGVMIGDQLATDGVLAKRLGYMFLHYQPELSSMPPGPRILAGVGMALQPVLFPGSRRARPPRSA